LQNTEIKIDSELILVVGNHNYSSWSLRPWLLMRQLEIPFRERRLALDTPEFGEQITVYGGAGRVPVLLADGFAIWDTLAIIEYLAEREQPGRVWPAAAQARARARSVSAEMHAGFEALRGALPMNCRATGRRVEQTEAVRADIQRIQDVWSECKSGWGRNGPWLFGEFSAADAMFAPVVSRFATYGVDLAPEAAAYRDALLDLPAMQAWYSEAARESEYLPAEEVGR
jgi:glutathione S-transferase